MAKHNIAGGRGHKARIPAELPVLPLKNIVVFPYVVAPLVISQEEHAKLVDEALVGGKIVGLFLQRDPKIEQKDDLHDVGTAGQIIKMLRFPDGSVRFLVQGVARIKIKKLVQKKPYFVAKVERVKEVSGSSIELEALVRNVLQQFEKVVSGTLSARRSAHFSHEHRGTEQTGRPHRLEPEYAS